MKARISALPILQYCSQAPRLDLGAGRAAAMSTAHHAVCRAAVTDVAQDKEDARLALARLTPEERDIVQERKPPAPLDIGEKIYREGSKYPDAFEYYWADVEVELAVTKDWKIPDSPEQAWLVGHADMVWEHGDLVVIGDIKATPWSSPDPPGESLQMLGYGALALSVIPCAERVVLAHWIVSTEEWLVSEPLNKFSLEFADIQHRIELAANNDGPEYSPGGHCMGCWSRLRCPAHMVQLDGNTLAVPGLPTDDPTPEQVAELLLNAKRHADSAEAAIAYCKAWAKERGPIVAGNQEFGPGYQKSPARLDKKALAAAIDLSQFETRGADVEVFRWRKRNANANG